MSDFEINLNNIKYEFVELDALGLFDNIVKLFELQKSQSYRQGYRKGRDDAGEDHKNSYRHGFEDGKREGFKWLPIEKLKTKYKDEKVLAIDNHGFYYFIEWNSKTKGFYDFRDGTYKDYTVFTHFMLLPELPQEQS